MAAPNRHQVLKTASITTSGNSGSLSNLGDENNPTVVVVIDVASAPTGSSPSITFTLMAVLPDGGTAPIQAGTAITAAGTQRIVAQNVLEQNVELSWTVTGTTPNFPSVSADLLFTSSDD